ncbi:MAG: hypothetical protein LRY30_01260 [Gammaproteobacteria bacterium]|nr:hypothetical protein [Gammaproteobacteria bacterium]
MLSFFSLLTLSILGVNIINNHREREYLKKFQAIIEKPKRLQLIQSALAHTIKLEDNEAWQDDIILTEEELPEVQRGLEFVERWTTYSHQLATFIPELFQMATGQQFIPRPWQQAIARLLIQANIPPVQQIEDKLIQYEIDRTYGKGGAYYISTHIEQQGLNLIPLFDLARSSRITIDLNRLLIQETSYEEALTRLINDPSNPIVYNDFKNVFLQTVKKILLHDTLQTTIKLAFGAFGWQLSDRIFIGATGYVHDPNILSWSWQTPLLFLITGLGAAISLNIGILASQYSLSRYDHGVHTKRYVIIMLSIIFFCHRSGLAYGDFC